MPDDLLRKARVIAAAGRELETVINLVNEGRFDRETLARFVRKLRRFLISLEDSDDLSSAELILKELRAELLSIVAASQTSH